MFGVTEKAGTGVQDSNPLHRLLPMPTRKPRRNGVKRLTPPFHIKIPNKVDTPIPRPRPLTRPSRSPHDPAMDATSETSRYIVRSMGIRSGNSIVEGTRIAVHDVTGVLHNGETVDTLRPNCFPQLSKSQFTSALPIMKIIDEKSSY